MQVPAGHLQTGGQKRENTRAKGTGTTYRRSCCTGRPGRSGASRGRYWCERLRALAIRAEGRVAPGEGGADMTARGTGRYPRSPPRGAWCAPEASMQRVEPPCASRARSGDAPARPRGRLDRLWAGLSWCPPTRICAPYPSAPRSSHSGLAATTASLPTRSSGSGRQAASAPAAGPLYDSAAATMGSDRPRGTLAGPDTMAASRVSSTRIRLAQATTPGQCRQRKQHDTAPRGLLRGADGR